MAKFEILSGSFPKQSNIACDFNQFTVRTKESGLRTYALKEAISSLEILSEGDEGITFKIALKDNNSFTAIANPKSFNVVHKASEAQVDENHKFILKEISPQKAKRRAIWTLLVLGLIACSVFWLFTNVKVVDNGSSKMETQKAEVIVFCKEVVKRGLKAPSTAKFPFLPNTIRVDPDTYEVNSYVDAQNGFGAMIRTNYTCRVSYIEGKMILVDYKVF